MPFNPEHLLNGIMFAHGMNQSENSKAPKVSPDQITSEHHEALKKLHQQLLQHHLTQMAHHASQVRVLTGGK